MARRRVPLTSRAGLVLHAIHVLRSEGYVTRIEREAGQVIDPSGHRGAWTAEALGALTDDERAFVVAVDDGSLKEPGALVSVVARRYGRADDFDVGHPLWPHSGPAPRAYGRAEIAELYHDDAHPLSPAGRRWVTGRRGED